MNDANKIADTAVRTFVAVHVPVEAQTDLARLTANLDEHVPKRAVRWVQPGTIHLTLRFIGNVPPGDIATLEGLLQQAVAGVGPFTLELGNAGCFPNGRTPHVLWVGVEGQLEPLIRLQSRVSHGTAAWGQVEGRAFHPHITLGRVVAKRRDDVERVGKAMDTVSIARGMPWRVEAIHLMQSVLTAHGAQHSPLARFELAG